MQTSKTRENGDVITGKLWQKNGMCRVYITRTRNGREEGIGSLERTATGTWKPSNDLTRHVVSTTWGKGELSTALGFVNGRAPQPQTHYVSNYTGSQRREWHNEYGDDSVDAH